MSRTGSMRSTQKIVLSLLIVCFLVLGLLVAILLVRQQQDIRSGAMNTTSNSFELTYPAGVQGVLAEQNLVLISGTLTANNLSSNRSIQIAARNANGTTLSATLYVDQSDAVVLTSQFAGGVVPSSYSQNGIDLNSLSGMLRAGQRVAVQARMGSVTDYQNILSPSAISASGTILALYISN